MPVSFYQCVRCGYKVDRKSNMINHLYKRKSLCPKVANNIVLTDEIKEAILLDHVYIIPPPDPVVPITQIINYNNTINNLISNMDPIDKLTKYVTHKEVQLLEFGDTIEQTFTKHAENLQQDPCKTDAFGVNDSLILDSNSMVEIINQASYLANADCKNMNVIFDQKFNKLKLYDMGKWHELIVIQGVTTLLSKIQEHYFNLYECYLIRKIEVSNIGLQDKAVIKDKLAEYYKFIGCFQIDPFVKDKNDSEILYNQTDDRYDSFQEQTDENTDLPIRYTNLYYKIKGETKTSEINKHQKTIIDIVKKNCLKNVDELNKRVAILFNMDEEFKQTILPSIK